MNAVSTVFPNTDLTNTSDQGRSTVATFFLLSNSFVLFSRFLFRIFCQSIRRSTLTCNVNSAVLKMSQISYSELRHDRQSTIRQSKALSIKPKASFKKTISKMQNMILFFYSVAFAAGSCENQGLFKKISFIYETFTKVVLNSLRYKIIIKHASAKGKIRSKMRRFEAGPKWSQRELVCRSGIFINMFSKQKLTITSNFQVRVREKI